MAGERYDPLPGITGIPKHVWTHLSPRGKRIMAAALALLVLGGTGAALALGPGITESKEERAAAERREAEQRTAALNERLERESRPLTGSGLPAAPIGLPDRVLLDRRERLVVDVGAAIEADARARVRAGDLERPIKRVDCEPYPRNVDGVGAESDLSQRSGRYACLAVTTDVKGSDLAVPAAIGYPFRARIDFISGRYAWCKISGRPGEGSLETKPLVTVPKGCGG